MKRLESIIKRIIRNRIAIIILLSSLMVVSIYQTLKHIRVDNSLSIWFLEDDPSYKAYIDFQENFGSDEIFIVMFPVDNAIGKPEKAKLIELHQSIDALAFVETSFSLAKAKYPIYANSTIKFDALYNTKRSEKGIKSLLSKLPNISNQLITEDYKNQFFYIQLNPTPTIEAKRQRMGEDIRQIIERHYTNYYLTGPPVLNEVYSKSIYKESVVFGGLTVLVITILLLFLLPHKRYLVVSLIAVAVPLILLFGIMTSLGAALNMISMLIPTILMVYSVSDAVHIINIYHKECISGVKAEKIKHTTLAIRKSLTPCFYTTLTTVVGYFALYLSPLPAFKNMGVFTCIGLVLSFVLVYVITIIGFSFMALSTQKTTPVFALKQISQSGLIQWINNFTTKYKVHIIVCFTLILCYGMYSVFQIKVDTDSGNLLAEGKAKQDQRIVENALHASSRIQLNIAALTNNTILNTEAMRYLEQFQKKLEVHPLINAPVSVVDIKRFLEKRTPVLFQTNVSQEKIESTLASVENNDNNFFKLFSEDFKSASITLGLKEMKTSQLKQVLFEIERSFEDVFPTDTYKLKINGFAVVFAQLNDFILQTQFKSFFAAFFVAFLCLWFFIKSLRTTLLVLIPNLLPLAVLAIFMNMLNIPLDVTTAMITPIMLGIAMDDTIHLVHKYRRSKYIKGSPETRMNNAMAYTGNALFSTTIALVGGFLIIYTSAVPSVSDFGLLCAITVAVALITDIFYLPALLKMFDK